MPNYRRSYYGSTYFFTVVTYNRRPILTSEAARNLLHTTWIDVQNRHPFTTDAIIIRQNMVWCKVCGNGHGPVSIALLKGGIIHRNGEREKTS